MSADIHIKRNYCLLDGAYISEGAHVSWLSGVFSSYSKCHSLVFPQWLAFCSFCVLSHLKE